MTVFDIINFNRELLDKLRKFNIQVRDTDYIDLFVDFNDMVAAGNKVSYAVAALAADYIIPT